MDWSYIAGFFDGEGHVSVIIRNNNVGLSQAGEAGRLVLNEIAELCRANGISCGVYPANETARNKPMYHFAVQRREGCRRFLMMVLPHLRVKRVAALDALRFFTLYPPIRGRWDCKGVSTQQLCNDHSLGMSLSELAGKYGLSKEAIRMRLKQPLRNGATMLWEACRAKKAAA